VAKINPVKVKQDADKLEKAGKIEQAITLYRQLVEDNPRDWNTVKKIGDLYSRINRNREAIDEYSKVAEFYAHDGFLLKAIAIWKQINKLDPAALEPYLNLAGLYAKQGLMMEAKSQYQIVVDEYIKRGKIRDAGDVLKKMADIDPADLKVRSKLADLYTRDGNSSKAVEEHVAIAEELNKKGHLAEALQVLEKGLKIDPKSHRLRLELARIHLVQKNYEKAVLHLEEAVKAAPGDTQVLGRLGEAYLGARRIEEAEAIFKKLLQLDPEDVESRIQMARVFQQQGQHDRAYEELVPAIEKLVARREGERAASLLQQIVQKNPAHVPSLLKLVELQRLLQKDAAVASAYSQLTEAYINLGQYEQAASVLEILVSLDPQNEQHKTKLQFVRSRGTGPRPAPAPVAPAPAAEAEEFDLTSAEEIDFDTTDEPSLLAPSTPPAGSPSRPQPAAAAAATAAPARPVIVASGPLSEEDREFIDEHLAEGKVFRKYGLVDKAADQFESIVARFPDHVDARRELRDVYREKGAKAKAAEHCMALAEIHRQKGDAAAAASFEEEARELAPEGFPAPAAPAPAPAPVGEAAAPAEEAEEEIPFEVEEGGLGELSEEGETFDLGEDAGADQEDLPGQFLEEETSPPAPAPAEEPEAAGEMGLAFEGDAEDAGLGLNVDDIALEEPPAPVPPPAPLVAAPARTASHEAATSSLPPDLQRVLDEVAEYVSLGFVDDARDALAELQARYPGHPAVAAKAAELGLEQAAVEEPPPASAAFSEASALPEVEESLPPFSGEVESLEDAFGSLAVEEPGVAEPEPELAQEPPPESELSLGEEELGSSLADEAAAAPDLDLPDLSAFETPSSEPEPPATGEVDLAAELDDLFGAQSAVEEPAPEFAAGATELGDAGLADIFKEFRKGVDKQLGKEDYDTRYNLGIAYKEMGLIDEAVGEFQLAAKDENRLLECASMLGICFMEKGMPKLAVKWFEKGLRAPDRREEEYMGLRYDLAMALEASGEADRALGLFSELYGQDANFRDVSAKVRELRAARR